MKKLFVLALAAGLLAVSAAAEAPKAADFEANNGFYFGPNKSEVVADEEHRSIPTITDVADGAQIAHKGYYQTGDNCGGAHSVEKYDLNGLSVTIRYDLVPEVTADTDCWIAIDFTKEPKGFYTNNQGNQGIENLIRFGGNYIDVREASDVKNWESIWGSQGKYEDAEAAAFGIKTGDVVTVTINRNEAGNYTFSYKNNDIDIGELPVEFTTLGDTFPDGKAYICLVASCELGDQEGFKYTVTDITNGVEMTEEEIAAVAAAKAAAELEEKKAASQKIIDEAVAALEKIKEDVDAAADDETNGLYEEGLAAIEEAKAAIEAGDFDAIQGLCDAAQDKAVEAKNAAKAVIKAAEDAVENVAEDAAEAGEEVVENVENTAEETVENAKKFPVWIIILIVVIVVIAIIAVVASSKKKSK